MFHSNSPAPGEHNRIRAVGKLQAGASLCVSCFWQLETNLKIAVASAPFPLILPPENNIELVTTNMLSTCCYSNPTKQITLILNVSDIASLGSFKDIYWANIIPWKLRIREKLINLSIQTIPKVCWFFRYLKIMNRKLHNAQILENITIQIIPDLRKISRKLAIEFDLSSYCIALFILKT